MVTNMSLGSTKPLAVVTTAIDRAIANGVIVVAAAGNEGNAGMGYPAAYAPVISVGASGWTIVAILRVRIASNALSIYQGGAAEPHALGGYSVLTHNALAIYTASTCILSISATTGIDKPHLNV